ncbi:hypothetical protein ACFYOT_05680 [Saccharothrix saharensis]|uniref:hypothetical protein n=1 Tax=Saccharothrix saharensis TaxID=571190 RepID=UPI00369C6C66
MDDLRPWREDALARVVSEALDRPEIRQAVASGDVTRQELLDAVGEAETAVFAAAADAESDYRAAVGPDSTALPPLRPLRFAARLLLLALLPALGFSVLVSEVLGMFGVDASTRNQYAGSVAIFLLVTGSLMAKDRRTYRRPALFAHAGYGAFVAALAVTAVSRWRGLESLLAVLALTVVTWRLVTHLMRFTGLSSSWSARAARRDEAYGTWLSVLLEEGVLPVLYTRVNEATTVVYSTSLTVREASGLARSDHLRMHVPTPASAELTRLVARLDGGSFAIAGPRGAGKTNLLRAFCGGRYREQDRAPDLAVLVAAPVEYVPQEFVVHLFAETCEAVLAHWRHDGRRRLPWRRIVPHPLVSDARANLELLRYVRTYADEISGKGGLKGFELSGKRALTRTGRALTYPELVKRFHVFLNRITTELAAADAPKPGRVLIGIDELDRIGTGEPARRFLNEIKAIFDVPGCHYLVSVSTEAQYDFELSGMGLRSVFDSSFDEVVRVDYLDFQYAQRLLRRYVLGLSEQFHAVAYAFSGGLARQLVRTARAIVELAREQPGRDIADVVRALAAAELTRACQATADALTAVDDREGVTDLLRLLDERPTTDLRTYGDRVRTAYAGRSERARQLRDAVAARAHFLGTAQRIFTAGLTEERMRALDLDELARARRYAGTNPDAGLHLLRDVNQRWAA